MAQIKRSFASLLMTQIESGELLNFLPFTAAKKLNAFNKCAIKYGGTKGKRSDKSAYERAMASLNQPIP
jgi:hypothetical protein